MPLRNHALYMSQCVDWATPTALYAALNAEFHFDLDPCPLHAEFDGLALDWTGRRVYCNPPYGRQVERWLEKAREADLAVYLLPSRTDTAWWHDHALRADEIRFIRGRLYFSDGGRAPFPSVILVYRKEVPA